MLGLNLIHVSKIGLRCLEFIRTSSPLVPQLNTSPFLQVNMIGEELYVEPIVLLG